MEAFHSSLFELVSRKVQFYESEEREREDGVKVKKLWQKARLPYQFIEAISFTPNDA